VEAAVETVSLVELSGGLAVTEELLLITVFLVLYQLITQ
jgi:hypothetical protein